MKNKILRDHFLNPRNIEPLKNATCSTIKKSDQCNDIVKMSLEIDETDTIKQVSIEVYGCGYAIAGASLFSESVTGKKVTQAAAAAEEAVKSILEEIPEKSRYCVTLSHRAYEKLLKQIDQEDEN